MFRRRLPRGIVGTLREFVWPTAGWGRAARYYMHRIVRMPGTPYAIAAGLACGVAVSILPVVGLHFLLAVLLALGLRANVVAALIGTAFGNPWTFPLIWVASHKVGAWLIGAEVAAERPAREIFSDIGLLLWSGDFAALGAQVWPVWWPMLLGSLPMAAAGWVLTYFPAALFIERRRLRRAARSAA